MDIELYDLPDADAYAGMPESQRRRIVRLVELNDRIIGKEEHRLHMERARIGKEVRAQAVAECKAELLREAQLAGGFPVDPDWLEHRREANAEMEQFNKRKRELRKNDHGEY